MEVGVWMGAHDDDDGYGFVELRSMLLFEMVGPPYPLRRESDLLNIFNALPLLIIMSINCLT